MPILNVLLIIILFSFVLWFLMKGSFLIWFLFLILLAFLMGFFDGNENSDNVSQVQVANICTPEQVGEKSLYFPCYSEEFNITLEKLKSEHPSYCVKEITSALIRENGQAYGYVVFYDKCKK